MSSRLLANLADTFGFEVAPSHTKEAARKPPMERSLPPPMERSLSPPKTPVETPVKKKRQSWRTSRDNLSAGPFSVKCKWAQSKKARREKRGRLL